MHYSLRPILGDDREIRPLVNFVRDRRFVLNGGDQAEVTSQFQCSVGRQRAVQELIWRSEDITPASGSSYFVTAQRAADFQLLNSVAE